MGLVHELQRQLRQARKAERKSRKPRVEHKPIQNRQARVRDPDYLKWIRRLPCIACLKRSEPGAIVRIGCDAAHIRHKYPEDGWKYVGMGEKPDDWRTVPLCREHHTEQHATNEENWWKGLWIYPPHLCADLRTEYNADGDGLQVLMQYARSAK